MSPIGSSISTKTLWRSPGSTCTATPPVGREPRLKPLQPDDPSSIGSYRLEARLGTGGMGRVYLARTPGGRRVVVKTVLPEHIHDTEFRTRFAREVEAARRVGGFHTAQVVDADPHADSPWIATAYIPAPTLEHRVREHGPLDTFEMRSLATGLAEGLEAIHGCGLVHRDLKPANILMADDGPRIIDFGIARPLGDTGLTLAGAVIGTLSYMSPEQARGSSVGPAGDVFSFGTVLAFAATGDNPFSADTLAAVVLKVITPAQAPSALPVDLRSLVFDCWDHDPSKRPRPRDIIGRFSPSPLPAAGESDPVRVGAGDPPDRTFLAPTLLRTIRAKERGPKKERKDDHPGAPDAPETTSLRRSSRETTAAISNLSRRKTSRRLLILGACAVLVISLACWPVLSGREEAPPTIEPVLVADTITSSHEDEEEAQQGIVSMELSPDGTILAVQDYFYISPGFLRPMTDARYVRLLDVRTGKIITTRKAEESVLFNGVVFTPEGAPLAIERDRESTWLRNISTGEITFTLDEEQGRLEAVNFGADRTVYATEDSDDRVHLWSMETDEPLSTLPEYDGLAFVGPFSPDGSRLVVRRSESLLIWDVDSGEEIATTSGDATRFEPPVFSPDGSAIAAGDADGTVHLWDAGSGELLSKFTAYPESLWRNFIGRETVGSIAFSSDGTMMASDGEGSEVHIWNVQTGAHVLTLAGPDGETGALLFGPTGESVVTSGENRTILRWDLP
nr:serine/threonine-protein kinase [Nocardiopsis prasina]